MNVAEKTLVGRRELKLLELPSVKHMANVLAALCREPSWVRTSVASLDRFATMTGNEDLEALLQRATADQTVAEQALACFAARLKGYAETQIAALAIGPKAWFTLNGVRIAWRPLTNGASPLPLALTQRQSVDRLVLLSLIGSGLHLSELLRLRIGDLGSLDADGRLVPDRNAEPLAVQHEPRKAKGSKRITFLSFQARAALLADLEQRAERGISVAADAPLIIRPNGKPATAATIAYARRRNQALIQAGNDVNVTMCRATGDFFRGWGMPGARFTERHSEREGS
ncbi:MAG: hypothetical protein NVSMB42_04370 [Herpetosiphon sp.]